MAFSPDWLVFAAVLAGCGGIKADPETPPPDPAADFIDGSRLKFGRWVMDEGYSLPTGTLYDTVLGEICTFRTAMDGRQRCLPLVFGARSLDEEFEDAACTVPLGHWDPSKVQHYVVRTQRDKVCAQRSRLEYREVGARFEGTEVYHATPSGCVTPPTPIPANEAYYRAGAIVPPERFGGADTVVGTTESRLAVARMQADDGASYTTGFFDRREQRSCSPTTTGDDLVRCIPSPRYSRLTGDPFAGSDCTGVPIATERTCTLDPGDLIVETSYAGCTPKSTIHEPGIPWDGDQISFRTPTGCKSEMKSNGRFVERGPEIDPSRFVELRRVPLGAHRLRMVATVDGSGASLPWEILFDSALDETCSFLPTSDGRYLCEPSMETAWFTDDACHEAAVIVNASPSPCGVPKVSKYVLVRGRLHFSGPKLDSAPTKFFYVTVSGNCLQLANPVEPTDYYSVGPEVGVDLAGAREERPTLP